MTLTERCVMTVAIIRTEESHSRPRYVLCYNILLVCGGGVCVCVGVWECECKCACVCGRVGVCV